jgi:hypothetical protein
MHDADSPLGESGIRGSILTRSVCYPQRVKVLLQLDLIANRIQPMEVPCLECAFGRKRKGKPFSNPHPAVTSQVLSGDCDDDAPADRGQLCRIFAL